MDADQQANDTLDATAAPTPPGGFLRSVPRGVLALWLIVISLLVFAVPLYLLYSNVRSNNARVQADIGLAQRTLAAAQAPPAEAQGTQNTLNQVQDTVRSLKEVYPTVIAGRVDWPAVMLAIGNYNPAQLAITSVVQAETTRLVVRGHALDEAAVVAYVRSLEDSKLFGRVIVQSMRAVGAPFATSTPYGVRPPAYITPTATISPTRTATPTTDPRDLYEPDDLVPKAIYPGQVQVRNFYPSGDVDKVTFLAKAGRFYRIYTANLAPGVDTAINLSLDQISFYNDDRSPGDLFSLILFQNTVGRDVDAYVSVTNRGLFASTATYQLAMEEVLGTPTPTAFASETPRPSETPFPTPIGPTATATPVPSATSTPDLRDPYEPDDNDPKAIILGQAQTRNFYPAYDYDRAKFWVKALRTYRVYTSALAPGVDTLVTVNVGAQTHTNDDRAAGDLASEVVFTAPAGFDQEAFVTVSNTQGQFGGDKTYQLTVVEVVATPTPDLRDQFEPDEPPNMPKDIAPGQPQQHSFFPTNDVDYVKFRAKAGHAYRVYTSDLAFGVDTLLSVAVGTFTYANDDRAVGDITSEIYFQNASSQDYDAVVMVVNKLAQYGGTHTYRLTVEDYAPTATPDPRDRYEPDDVQGQAKQAFPGQPQTNRTFAPNGDVDWVWFWGKGARTYEVSTSALAAGVDTVLSVIAGSNSYSSDDVGAGDISSKTSFLIPAGPDVQVYIRVSNKGSYGSARTYTLNVVDIGAPDSYEPDNTQSQAKQILPDPNLPPTRPNRQMRTFSPQGDVDWVWFLAKGGKTYELYTGNDDVPPTSRLAPGVDTVLWVKAGTTVGAPEYTSDDAPGRDLASTVRFSVPAGPDVQCVARITNKGTYGPDKEYALTLIEVAPGAVVPAAPVIAHAAPRAPAPVELWPVSARVGLAAPLQDVLPQATTTGRAVEFVIALELKTQ